MIWYLSLFAFLALFYFIVDRLIFAKLLIPGIANKAVLITGCGSGKRFVYFAVLNNNCP